jgi:hypothetical protein
VERSDFFKGMWLSPLALACGPRTPPNSSSAVDAQGDAALAELLATTGEVFNVKSFGAVDDGSTDDSVAWLRAIAAMPLTGGILDARSCKDTVLNETIDDGGKDVLILLGYGTYSCNPSTDDQCFSFTGESGILGVNRRRTTLVNNNVLAHGIFVDGTNAVRSNFSDFNFENGVAKTSGDGIRVTKNARTWVRRVDCTGHVTGFRLDSIITSRLQGCVASGGTDGFGLYHTTQTSTSVHYDNCYAVGCSRYGYYIDGQANYIKYSNCASDNPPGGWTNAYFFNNNDSRIQSVTLDTCAHEDLSDSSTGASIKAIDVEGLTIINPYLWRPGAGDNDSVIDLRGCRGVTILNPFVNRRTTNDISITNSATPITAKNIVIVDGLQNDGTNLVVSDTNGSAIVIRNNLVGPMSIDGANGRVGIGTGSDTLNVPFTVEGGTGDAGIRVQQDQAGETTHGDVELVPDRSGGGRVLLRDGADSVKGQLQIAALYLDGTKVTGAQGSAVADASGGSTVDTEARRAINDVLARLRTHGLIGS